MSLSVHNPDQYMASLRTIIAQGRKAFAIIGDRLAGRRRRGVGWSRLGSCRLALSVAATTAVRPGCESGYCESFNARFRDELLDGEIFYSLKEAQTMIETWRRHCNTSRPHSALG
jgi:hypothetical protein